MIKTFLNQKTILSPKGQKIIAAIFLVTGHLPESDPMRQKLRAQAVALVDITESDLVTHCGSIVALLQAAQYAGLVSEGNMKIIEAELKYFADPSYRNDTLVSALFPTGPLEGVVHKGHISDKKTSISDMSYIQKVKGEELSNKVDSSNSFNKDKKDKRQEKILSYIIDRKSANVKDISALFPDVSEKTIQRELGVLVSLGKVTKRGDKRWSLYLPA